MMTVPLEPKAIDDLKAIRDIVVKYIFSHEVNGHGGAACMDRRAMVVALVAQSLGVDPSSSVVRRHVLSIADDRWETRG